MNRFVPQRDLTLLQLLGKRTGDRPGVTLSCNEWGDLCRRARVLQVAPLFYERLRRRAELPAEIRAWLRHQYLVSAARNTRRFQQLGRLLALFREKAIEVVILKGAALAESAYGDIALRTMSDVDLLVREADLERAKQALLADDFRQPRRAPLETKVLHGKHLVPFVRGGKRPFTLELHWRLLPSRDRQADPAEFWARTRATRVAGVEVLTLCPEDLLLHTCLHACIQHQLTLGVRALCDVDVILHAYAREIDWDAFTSRAELWGARYSAALMFTYARELFETPIPAGVLERLSPSGLEPAVVDLADRQIFTERTAAPYVSITLTRLFHAPGVGEFAAILRERFFPPRDELLVRYPATSSAWLPLLYLMHPFALLRLHGRAALNLLRGKGREQVANTANQRGLELAAMLGSSPPELAQGDVRSGEPRRLERKRPLYSS